MGEKEDIIKGLMKFLKNLNKEFEINTVLFFGSRANGKIRKDSDIDLIIVSPDFSKMNFLERGGRMYDFWEMDYPVDFLCYTPNEFNKLKKRISIVKEAIEEGIIIK